MNPGAISTFSVLRFLTSRYIKNNIRRAFQTPARAIATVLVALLVLATLAGVLVGLLVQPPATGNEVTKTLNIDAAKMLFMIVQMLLFVSFMAMSGGKRANKLVLFLQGDINYLFPSPLDRFKVFRGLLLVRGSFVMLLIMIWSGFYAMIWGGSMLKSLIAAQGNGLTGFALLVYPCMLLPMALTSIFLGATLSLLDVRGKKGWTKFWGALTVVLLICLPVLIKSATDAEARGEELLSGIISALDHPVVFWLLIPFRALADAALVRFNGWTPSLLPGLLIWIPACIAAHSALKKQAPWFYEFAAEVSQRGAEARARKKNISLMRMDWIKKKSIEGTYSISGFPVIRNWKPKGVWALLWRDLMIAWRMSKTVTLCFILYIVIGYPLLIKIIGIKFPHKDIMLKFLYGVSQSFIFIYTLVEVTFIEHLRRIDIQKALPFSLKKTVAISGLSALIPFAFMELLLFLMTAVLTRLSVGKLLYGMGMTISFMYIGMLSLLLLEMNNPDKTDYVQRMIMGIIRLPLLILVVLPGGVIVAGGFIFGFPLIINGALTLFINAGVSLALVGICAKKYEGFNPVE